MGWCAKHTFLHVLCIVGDFISMKYIVTGKQMQKADQYTIEQIGIPSMVLMERAALRTVKALEMENVDCKNVLVVCGSGNNGGDGYAIARLLHIKGYRVSICFVGDETKRSEENKRQKEIADYYKIRVKQNLEEEEYSVIIDAVFGVGLSRRIEGRYYSVIEQLNRMKGYKVAVDIPSGINDNTGKVMGIAFRADLTVTFAFAKRGLMMEAGNPYVGKLCIADIGIYADTLVDTEDMMCTYEWKDFLEKFPKRKPNSHKGTYGKVLLIVGNKGMSGAAFLCAKAAYAVGVGLVQIYTHEENRIVLQETLPEAIVTTYTEYDKQQVDALLQWPDVIGMGCGLGVNDTAEKIVKHVIESSEVPCIVDADALNLIAKDMSMLEKAKQPLVLTPHMKEMTRLLSCTMEELQERKMECLREFLKQYPVTCVLKDARTIIGEGNRAFCLNTTGNSALAKGGTGDVLAGVLAGILAQKTMPYEAACLGAFLHGMAGDRAAKEKGEYSVLAGDVANHISEILKQI